MMRKVQIYAGLILLASTTFSAHAEISTSIKEVEFNGDAAIFSTKETSCWVKEPTFFGNGGVSPLSNLFTEAGMNIVSDTKVPCKITYRGYITTLLGDNKEKVFAMPVDFVALNQAALSDVAPAITAGDVGADSAMNRMDGYGTSKGMRGENAGSAAGAGAAANGLIKGVSGLAGAAGGAFLGSIVDSATSNQPVLVAGIGHIRAEIEYKKDGRSFSGLVDVFSASNSTEKPIDLIRAVVARVVTEIKLKNGESKPSTPAAVGVVPDVSVAH